MPAYPSVKINTLLIDDDPQWRMILTKLVQMNSLLNLVGTATSAMDAYSQLTEQEVDLLICDIEMPDMSGLTFVRSMQTPPLVIFVTSHVNYALDCYEVSPVDFLLKPIDPGRFLSSIEKARQRFMHRTEQSQIDPYFFVRDNLHYVQIAYRDVLYIQANENSLNIVTPTQTYTPILSISKIEQHLKGDLFLRIHRSYIVNRAAIARIGRSELVLTSGETLPVGDQYRALLNRTHIGWTLVSRNG